MKLDKITAQQETNLYSEVVSSVIEDAIGCEISNQVGADEIYSWAKSIDGKSILAWAGYEPNEKTAQMIRDCVLEGAKSDQNHSNLKLSA